MDVPCPVPLTDPWSPAGYRVVEVPTEGIPTVPAVPSAAAPNAAAPNAVAPLPARPPSSPLGYRVTVTDAAPSTPAARPAPVRVKVLSRRRASALRLWAPLAAGGCLVFVGMCALITAYVSQAQHAEPQSLVLGTRDLVAPRVFVPRGNVNQVADMEMPPAMPAAKADCAVCRVPRAEEQETFGTSVSFRRNPTEALHVADDERKLAFVLHVSGNFEEARFT